MEDHHYFHQNHTDLYWRFNTRSNQSRNCALARMTTWQEVWWGLKIGFLHFIPSMMNTATPMGRLAIEIGVDAIFLSSIIHCPLESFSTSEQKMQTFFEKIRCIALFAVVCNIVTTTSTTNGTVSLRRCVNFQASYAGSWLARASMLRSTPMGDKVWLWSGSSMHSSSILF